MKTQRFVVAAQTQQSHRPAALKFKFYAGSAGIPIQIRLGDRFVREYADPILRVCAAYSLGRSDAQDICQDIFLTLLEETRTFDTPDHERAFILRCAINACKDILKSSRFRRTAPLEEAERVAAPAPGEEHQVWQAVAELPAKERILVYLFYCEGYSLEEAARMCGCSYAAARQRLSRARKRLRTELEVYHG